MTNFFSWQDDDLYLKVRVQPKSSQTRVVGVMGDTVKISVTAAPVDGKANACLSKYLAKQFHVPVSRVALVKGRNGRSKKLIITSPVVIPHWISSK